MAQRPVFIPDPGGRLVKEQSVEFEWHPGFAVSQKQKSITSLHAAASEVLDDGTFLEISTKSEDRRGWQLSAFNLLVTSEAGAIPVEAAFQGSKVFSKSGQHPEIYGMDSGRDIKKFVGQFSDETITGFRFGHRDWATAPKTAFYDWLYLGALVELSDVHPELAGQLSDFSGFTDIEFNPQKSLNCQARSCALHVALSASHDVASLVQDIDQLLEVVADHGYWDLDGPSETPTEGTLF